MFGLLLGYPVVYWYKDVCSDDNGNCLDNVDLIVHTFEDGISFSCPTCVGERIINRIEAWASGRGVQFQTKTVNRDKYAL